ncbi:SRPBCC family protein [Streptomyces sp. JB150]|uniref:SRPBCC family protein n=1 Tax=Streptomyces sp. JB150 TaxID=2714844 RepID=UPI00140972AF|nr:SRPBCC family protein [Streptomyces sp. JB150]QIJ63809.1 carbon monoxide dehydrogenase [Streptomyces sp. JB150]
MEHEVFVPVPADRLKAALTDPARVARAVPGLQQEAGAEPVAGRLKLRAGGTTITYRGTAEVSARDDGAHTLVGEGAETRGTGTVKLSLTLRLRPEDEGTTVVFEGTASADGRITELPEDAVRSAATRLLNRFAENLGEEAGDEPADDEPADDEPAAVGGEDAPRTAPDDVTRAEARDSLFDTEVPPPSLDPDTDDAGESDASWDSSQPPAEAAHARRTMIGRSAEEVDHAPPRGRYAPVPAPQTVARSGALRWAAPAAALAVASAIVVGRALRRRR